MPASRSASKPAPMASRVVASERRVAVGVDAELLDQVERAARGRPA